MDEIVNRYREVCNSNGCNSIVIGVETPMGSVTIGWIKHLVFGRCSSHVLNAGAYLGPAGTVQRLLQIITSKQEKDDQKTLDHSLLQKVCVFNRSCSDDVESFFSKHVVFDTHADLFFHSACRNLWGYVYRPCDTGLTVHLDNPITGRRPAFIHGPGGLDLNPLCVKLEAEPFRYRRTLQPLTDGKASTTLALVAKELSVGNIPRDFNADFCHVPVGAASIA